MGKPRALLPAAGASPPNSLAEVAALDTLLQRCLMDSLTRLATEAAAGQIHPLHLEHAERMRRELRLKEESQRWQIRATRAQVKNAIIRHKLLNAQLAQLQTRVAPQTKSTSDLVRELRAIYGLENEKLQ